MAVSTILWDLGGTLVHFDFAPIYETLARKSRRAPTDVKTIIDARYPEFCCGRMTGDEWRDYLSAALAVDLAGDGFPRLWADIFRENPPMIDLARRLRGKARQVLLSNTDAIHLPWCRERFPLGEFLDGMILSYEVGAVKPDRRIYADGLARFGLDPAACVFIDDIPANLDGAAAYGIATILATSAGEVEERLAALGVRA